MRSKKKSRARVEMFIGPVLKAFSRAKCRGILEVLSIRENDNDKDEKIYSFDEIRQQTGYYRTQLMLKLHLNVLIGACLAVETEGGYHITPFGRGMMEDVLPLIREKMEEWFERNSCR